MYWNFHKSLFSLVTQVEPRYVYTFVPHCTEFCACICLNECYHLYRYIDNIFMLRVVVNCNSGISCCLSQTVGVCGTMIPTLKLFAYNVNKCKLNHINILTHTHWQIRTCVNIHVCCYHMYVLPWLSKHSHRQFKRPTKYMWCVQVRRRLTTTTTRTEQILKSQQQGKERNQEAQQQTVTEEFLINICLCLWKNNDRK